MITRRFCSENRRGLQISPTTPIEQRLRRAPPCSAWLHRCAYKKYQYFSKLGLPYISLSTIFKIIAAAVALAVMLFGLIKALIKAIKMLLKSLKKVIKVAGSLKMPNLSGEFLPDIPGLPKLPKLKLPSVPGLPSPPKLSLGKMFSLSGLSFSPLMAPLAILAALALLTKYRIFKARLWPPLSGLPGLRNGLYRLPYRGFKGVFSHLPYFDQLYNAGGRLELGKMVVMFGR